MSRRGRRLVPWIPLLLAVALGAVGLWLETVDPRGGNPTDALMVPLLLTYAVAGGLIAARERGNAVGWLLNLLGLSMVGSFAIGRYDVVGFDHALAVPFPEVGVALSWSWILALSCPVLLAFVVPTGRPLTPAWKRVYLAVQVVLLVVIAIFAFGNPGGAAGQGIPGADFANPIYVPALRSLYDFIQAGFFIYVVVFGTGAAALTVRFRRSRGVERQQLKWILFGMVAMLAGITASNFASGALSDALWAMGMLPLPVSLAIAIGRHRLYDIDLVIKRSLTYGTLSVLLVGIEVGGILLLQELLSGVTGGQNYAVAATTLGVAALFQPARRRIQAWVDRRFDRSRYDLEQVADGFGARLRDRLDLRDVEAELVNAAAASLRPTRAWVWLRTDEDLRT